MGSTEVQNRIQILYEDLQALAARPAVEGSGLTVSYGVPGYGTLIHLQLGGYEVIDRGEGWGQKAALLFACTGDRRLEFHYETKSEHERATELLASHGRRFSWLSIAN